jgi:signal transduction histidine kinase
LRGSGERKVIGLPELQTQINNRSFQTHSPLLQIATGKEFEVNIRPFKTVGQRSGKLVLLRDTSWIRKVSQQKSEFVTNISHDLRAPLNLMRGYVSLLENIGNLSDEQSKYVRRIQGTIENMSRLVSKVMSLEQLDNEEALHYSTFDIKEMVNDSIASVALPAQQRKVTINTDLAGLRVAHINADRVMMQQAVFNLLENAVKFSNRGGSVQVSASSDQDTLHLAVQDNGKGIAPLDQPKLFTRFFHVDDDERFGTGGQGLGLSIVKSIATRHGGNVTVRSQLGEGSTFYLDIPLKR